MLRRSQLLDKPHLLSLIDSSETHRWIGPRRLIMVRLAFHKKKRMTISSTHHIFQSYPILSHKIYNISTAHPDENFAQAPTSSWTTRGSKSKMLETFADFCPRVRELLSLVQEDEVCEWKLRVHQPLPTWVDGRTALLGDACHPTLPHIAQVRPHDAFFFGKDTLLTRLFLLGCSTGCRRRRSHRYSAIQNSLERSSQQNLEDISSMSGNLCSMFPRQLISKGIQILRKERAEYCVVQAAENGRELHLSDEEAAERDRRFRAANKEGGANPDRVVDK